jgi:capsular polysaccharide biosynthesis protein
MMVTVTIRDFLSQLFLWIKMIRFRILTRVLFHKPASLSNDCYCVEVIAPEKLAIPIEFLAHFRAYHSRPFLEFASENVHACTFTRDVIVHEARFIRLDGKHYVDVDNQSRQSWPVLRNLPAANSTKVRTTLVMPWGGGSAGYGDFIIMLLPKLARLLETIPKEERDNFGVCLPHFHRHPWAIEYLDLLGIRKHQILDVSRTVRLPAGGRLILGSGPRPGNAITHPHDIRLMIRQLRANISPPRTTPWRRLYISRKTGRKMSNEASLLDGLAERGFEIVYLEDLSLPQQITLFQESAVIAGPHGAGHANIIWSSPGTRLLEVFHPSWMHPCYALISEILGIQYHCLVGNDGSSKGSWTGMSRHGIFEDASIDPEIFFRKLDTLLN